MLCPIAVQSDARCGGSGVSALGKQISNVGSSGMSSGSAFVLCLFVDFVGLSGSFGKGGSRGKLIWRT